MADTRRKFGADFREGAVRRVRGTGSRSCGSSGTWASTRAPWVTAVNADKRRGVDGTGALSEDARSNLADCVKRTPSWQ
jgi:hypothetical protein